MLLKHVLGGTLLGVLVLYPLTTAAFWSAFSGYRIAAGDALGLIYGSLLLALDLILPHLAIGFALLGAVLGLVSGWYLHALRRASWDLQEMKREKEAFTLALIALGENRRTVFRPSFRWDPVQQQINLGLEEEAVSILGKLLHRGGGLLILGVCRDGQITGLEADYKTLWHPSQAAFRQHLLFRIPVGKGSPLREDVHVWFEQVRGKDICLVLIGADSRRVQPTHDGRFSVHAPDTPGALYTKASLAHLIRHLPRN